MKRKIKKTVRLLAGDTMIPNMSLLGEFRTLYLVGNEFWAFTLNQLATPRVLFRH